MSALTSNRFWLGIDLGQETFDASLAPISSTLTGWRKLPCRSFSTQQDGLKQFLNWLTEQLPPMAELAGVCLESTGGYSRRFAEQLLALAPQLPQVSIINPKRSLDFARSLGLRDKTDRIDAGRLSGGLGESAIRRVSVAKRHDVARGATAIARTSSLARSAHQTA